MTVGHPRRNCGQNFGDDSRVTNKNGREPDRAVNEERIKNNSDLVGSCAAGTHASAASVHACQ